VVFRGGQRLEYNVNNELSLVLATNGTLSKFGYGGSGERLWKSSSTNSLQVWIGGAYEEKNGQILYHIVAAGRLVCTFDSTGTNVLEYYHPDHLTSSSIQTDSTGAVIQHYEYSAFGQSRYTQSSTAFPVSRRYTSQILDDDTGLYYYNFRYYDPVLGRFMQADDIIPEVGDPQSWNRYSYVLNNPLRYTDPMGHETYWEGVGNVFLGYYDAGAGVVKGTVFVVAHPIRTAEGLGTAIAHPINTGKAIGQGISETWNSGTRGQGEVVGSALFTIGTLVAPAAQAGKVGQAANLASKGEEVGAAAEKVEAAVHRVITPGKPQFQLRSGEKGLSVFDASKVGSEDVLAHFREGSQLATKTVKEIESHGLTVERTAGHPDLPQHLNDAHMEIRPGPNMERPQFKQAIKKLEPSS